MFDFLEKFIYDKRYPKECRERVAKKINELLEAYEQRKINIEYIKEQFEYITHLVKNRMNFLLDIEYQLLELKEEKDRLILSFKESLSKLNNEPVIGYAPTQDVANLNALIHRPNAEEALIEHWVAKSDPRLKSSIMSTEFVGSIRLIRPKEIRKYGISQDTVSLVIKSNKECLELLKRSGTEKTGELSAAYSARPAYAYMDAIRLPNKTACLDGRQVIRSKSDIIVFGTAASYSLLQDYYPLIFTESEGCGSAILAREGFRNKSTIKACAAQWSEGSRALHRYKSTSRLGDKIEIEELHISNMDVIKLYDKYDLLGLPANLAVVVCDPLGMKIIRMYEGPGAILVSKESVRENPGSVKSFQKRVINKIKKINKIDYLRTISKNKELFLKLHDECQKSIQ
jgi:hypothetical protein